MPAARRFPPPWSIEELNDACFVVIHSAGQKLAYVYFEDEPGRRTGRQVAHEGRGAADRGEYRPVRMDQTKTEPQARRSGLFYSACLRDYRLVCSSTNTIE